MHAVVCIKQVPDSLDLKINPETNTLVRKGVLNVINPDDVHALEEALRLKEQAGGRVTVITMGPPQSAEALRETIAMGANEGILITDRTFAAADTLATSRVLARAIELIAEQEPVDIVLCGRQTTDSDTGQVGPGVAARLGFTQLTYVMKIDWIDFDKREIQVRRRLEDATEVVWGRLPALLTVLKEINKPRRPPLTDVLRAATHPITTWDRETLGLSREEVGVLGSPTIVAKLFAPPARPPGKLLAVRDDDLSGVVQEVTQHLVEVGLIGQGRANGG
ncbi:MAG: electron transfer flavoprotein subunit beta/FixA family protein [Chloroflexi bacterium]|nr:electron transfer flavoprotein subunit beta/FixA family protein [Chloroflexota bacterium]